MHRNIPHPGPCKGLQRRFSCLSSVLLGTLLLGAALGARAESFWLNPEAGSLQVRYGDAVAPTETLPAALLSKAFRSDRQALALTRQDDRLLVAERTGGDVHFHAAQAESDSSLVFHHARFGRREIRAAGDLELVPTQPEGNTFRLMWKGSPVAASLVNVSTSAGWRRVLRPAADGTVTLEPLFPGTYLLEVVARLNGGATFDGRKYAEVRHVASLSFVVAP
jgi:hypothetical protein